MYRYRVNYGWRADNRARTAFIVCDPNMVDMRAQDIVNTFYDNSVEQGIIFDNTIEYYIEKVRDELTKNDKEWSEDDIWTEAYLCYYTHRASVTWYEVYKVY